jgi:NAD(P)-dependent dehydrogenase (short-subunit alcohol dehydrogenase family)
VAEVPERRVAIVTGAARGLGRASVAELDGLGLQADVSKPEEVRRVVEAAMARHGRIDVLVNNAGIVRPTRAGHEWERGLRDYEEVMGANFKGAFLFGRAVAPIMIEQKTGHIVNVSTDHVYPVPGERVWGHGGMDLYNASKWALNGLTLDWATTLRRHHVRVNGLCPGATDTPMLREFSGDVGEDVTSTWMKPEQVCELLLQLLGEGPEGRTGHNLGCWVGRPIRLEDSVEVGHRHPEGT